MFGAAASTLTTQTTLQGGVVAVKLRSLHMVVDVLASVVMSRVQCASQRITQVSTR